MDSKDQEGTSFSGNISPEISQSNEESMDFEDFITNEDPFSEVPKNDLAMDIDLLDLPVMDDKTLNLPEEDNILDEIDKIVGGKDKSVTFPIELEETTSNLEYEKDQVDNFINDCMDEKDQDAEKQVCNDEKDQEIITHRDADQEVVSEIEEGAIQKVLSGSEKEGPEDTQKEISEHIEGVESMDVSELMEGINKDLEINQCTDDKDQTAGKQVNNDEKDQEIITHQNAGKEVVSEIEEGAMHEVLDGTENKDPKSTEKKISEHTEGVESMNVSELLEGINKDLGKNEEDRDAKKHVGNDEKDQDVDKKVVSELEEGTVQEVQKNPDVTDQGSQVCGIIDIAEEENKDINMEEEQEMQKTNTTAVESTIKETEDNLALNILDKDIALDTSEKTVSSTAVHENSINEDKNDKDPIDSGENNLDSETANVDNMDSNAEDSSALKEVEQNISSINEMFEEEENIEKIIGMDDDDDDENDIDDYNLLDSTKDKDVDVNEAEENNLKTNNKGDEDIAILGLDDESLPDVQDDDKNEETDFLNEKTNEDNPSIDIDSESLSKDKEDKSQTIEEESLTGIASVRMEDFQNDPMQDDEASDPFGSKDDPKITPTTNQTDIDSNSNTQTGFLDDVQNKTNNDNVTIIEESRDNSPSNPPEENTKYMITHCHENEEKSCGICSEKLISKFLAKNNVETIYICGNKCLDKFKDDHADDYVIKILRLRAFAVQEKDVRSIVSSNKQQDFHVLSEDNYEKDLNRKCGTCKTFINLTRYISWEAKDFCREACILKFQRSLGTKCMKCLSIVAENLFGKFCVRFGNVITQFCSTTCLVAFKKVFKFCAYCQEDIRNAPQEFQNFCSKRCVDVFQNTRIPLENGECAVCHSSKPVEIKYKMHDKMEFVCSFPCFVAYKFVNNIDPVKCVLCLVRFEMKESKFSIYKGPETIPLCSQECQKIYLIKNRKIVVCTICAVKKYDFDMITIWEDKENLGFTCSNACLHNRLEIFYEDKSSVELELNEKQLEILSKEKDFIYEGERVSDVIKLSSRETKLAVHKVTLTKPKPIIEQRNIGTMCKPNTITKAIMCKPRERTFAVQTDKGKNTLYVPVPVPINVMVPLHMHVEKIPMLVPIPIPLPVPIFIPTNRKSIKGIGKEIEKIKSKIPSDPLEAEILMMADMAAGDKRDETSSESEEENLPEATTSFGDDVLRMALTMVNEFDEPTNTHPETSKQDVVDPTVRIETIMEAKRKNIRQQVRSRTKRTDSSASSDSKADSNLTLKYTFGVNAWKQWVTMKNNELKKTRRPKLFKTEILQLNSEDLNYALSFFVKEVRKPNGTEYAPDTIYYLCLGIQQYLYENGRVDHLFCDPFYEKFTDSFNEVCLKFANIYSNSQYIVTRVEEEHLWESKQLGAHSPLVLLNTLMFFNTKHFSLTTVEEHLQLSFSHIMKHWKRNPSAPGCRNVLLRFYPPQKGQTGRKRRVYEQQENEINPLRCPVKLYEFYLSKCPESVKTRNDVFYLQPERSCVPDSPVWYSTMAMDTDPLEKMLNRVKMIKEINISLLTITAR